MSRKKLLFIIPFVLIVGFFYFPSLKIDTKNINKPDKTNISDSSIKNLIPKEALLREYKKIPNLSPESYLVLYVLNSKTDELLEPSRRWSAYTSCASGIEGRAIEGNYHLALIQNNKLINDVSIPGSGSNVDLSTGKPLPPSNNIRLAYQNIRMNADPAYLKLEGSEPSVEQLEYTDVDLMNFQDLNGDGYYYEFLLNGFTLACGHTEHLVLGYSKANNKAVVYPIINKDQTFYWVDNFLPNSEGKVEQGWSCGDHGSDTEEKNTYRFDPKKESYYLEGSSTKKCY